MDNKTTTISLGTGFTGILALIFIVLKLCGVITWSWLWVLAPIWIPLALGISFILISWIIVGLIALFAKLKK